MEQLKLGENIRKLRKEKGMTQVQFASKLIIANSHICDIEMGRCTPSIKMLRKIAEVLEVEIKDLF